MSRYRLAEADCSAGRITVSELAAGTGCFFAGNRTLRYVVGENITDGLARLRLPELHRGLFDKRHLSNAREICWQWGPGAPMLVRYVWHAARKCSCTNVV